MPDRNVGGSFAGSLGFRATVQNTDGTQTGDLLVVDSVSTATLPPPRPQLGTFELRFNVRGGQANTVAIAMEKSGAAVGVRAQLVDVTYEVLKR
jgi:hypothetical protein